MKKSATKKAAQLIRQGDVMFIPIAKIPEGQRTKRENGVAAYGEVTGHSHRLSVEDRARAEVLEIGGGLFCHVSEDGVRLQGAEFVHEEHGTVTLPAGDYQITIQREYSAESIRSVID